MSHVTCHVSHVMSHLSPTDTAMDPPPANSTTIQSGLVCQKTKTQIPPKNTYFFVEIFQKLYGVGPVHNRPSTNQLHHFVQQEKFTFFSQINQSFNYEAVCKTAPATQGLLKISSQSYNFCNICSLTRRLQSTWFWLLLEGTNNNNNEYRN